MKNIMKKEKEQEEGVKRGVKQDEKRGVKQDVKRSTEKKELEEENK